MKPSGAVEFRPILAGTTDSQAVRLPAHHADQKTYHEFLQHVRFRILGVSPY